MEIKSITTGKQIWMADNPGVIFFINGDDISEIESDEDWVRLSEDDILAGV